MCRRCFRGFDPGFLFFIRCTHLTRYLGCLGLIKPEVDLIRTILRTSSRLDKRWVLAESGECDALLVYNADKSVAPFTLKPTTQLIMIRRRGEKHDGHVFLKPFRADELIDTLIVIDSESHSAPALVETTSSQLSTNLYRLKKWPPADVLHQHKNYMLLAVYLSRGTKNLQDLMTLSGQGEALCSHFLKLLQERGLLQIEGGKGDSTVASIARPARIQDEKKNFFSLLRTKLGLTKK
mgnify:CR=1 FL=1